MVYSPDVWVILKIERNTELTYKVLAGWYGGYLNWDSWKINSGITKVEKEGDCYLFYGHSGSIYKCHKDIYRLSGMTAGILENIKTAAQESPDISIEMLPEETDWCGIQY